MKGYKKIVPVAMAALMLTSTYQLISNNRQNINTYKNYLRDAREYADKGIVVDSIEAYNQAILLKDTVEIRCEAADMLTKNNMNEDCIIWLEDSVNDFPKEAKLYEKLLKLYIKNQDYRACYELKDTLEGERVSSKKIEEKYESIAYTYTIDYQSYTNAKAQYNEVWILQDEDKWAAANKKGSVLIKDMYEWMGDYSQNLIPVCKDGQYFFIDVEGNKKSVLPESINCTGLGNMCEGKVAIKKDDSYVYYDNKYNELFGSYVYASSFNEGVAAVQKEEGWYLIDENGDEINENAYEDIIVNENQIAFSGGRAFVNVGDGYVMVDKKGKKLSEDRYNNAALFQNEKEYAAVQTDGKWGFVNHNGKIVISPEYNEAHSFSNGLAAVQKDGKWGYINDENELKIDYLFNDCKEFNDVGRTFVVENTGWTCLTINSYQY